MGGRTRLNLLRNLTCAKAGKTRIRVSASLRALTFLTPFHTVSIVHFSLVTTGVAYPHHVDADSDPAFHFDDPNPDPTFQFEVNPDPTTHFFPDLDPPMLQNDPLELPPVHFDADLDPDPASLNEADPAFATLVTALDDLGRFMYQVPYLGLRWNPCSSCTAR